VRDPVAEVLELRILTMAKTWKVILAFHWHLPGRPPVTGGLRIAAAS